MSPARSAPRPRGASAPAARPLSEAVGAGPVGGAGTRCRGYLPNQALGGCDRYARDASRARPARLRRPGAMSKPPVRPDVRSALPPITHLLTAPVHDRSTCAAVGGDQEPHKRPEEGGRDAACAGRGGPAVVRVPFGTGSLQLPHAYARGTPLTVRPALCRVRRCTASARPSRRSRMS